MKKPLNLPPFDPSCCPEPVFDNEPDLVRLYWRAWELAWEHIKGCDDAPVSPFMDEAFSDHTIWIWDTCFMVHFCKYAPQAFPGIGSFENFYQVMHDGKRMSLTIQHPDNPPLFAWIEYEYAKLTGDVSRLRRIVVDKQYLQKHFAFIEQAVAGAKPAYGVVPIAAQREPLGYRWSGNPNGMDNTPRGHDDYDSILWVDLLAQQALAADHIAAIAQRINEPSIAAEYAKHAHERRDLLNRHYWDEEDGIYYDIEAQGAHRRVKVKTPASYWPMLAGACSPQQAARLEAHARDPQIFGGEIPWPTVDRRSPAFDDNGRYWRGSVWLPTAYMAIKALDRYGYHTTAAQSAINLLRHMQRTHDQFQPHTIWECYSPTQPRPANTKSADPSCLARPDFCGWSAIGPISLLIEDVLGFHEIDALEGLVRWNKHLPGRHGIRRLRFADVCTDILGQGRTITIASNQPYRLEVNGTTFQVQAGEQTFTLPPAADN